MHVCPLSKMLTMLWRGRGLGCGTAHQAAAMESYPRYYRLDGTSSCETAPKRGTRGVVLLRPRVWKDVVDWALEIGISCITVTHS